MTKFQKSFEVGRALLKDCNEIRIWVQLWKVHLWTVCGREGWRVDGRETVNHRLLATSVNCQLIRIIGAVKECMISYFFGWCWINHSLLTTSHHRITALLNRIKIFQFKIVLCSRSFGQVFKGLDCELSAEQVSANTLGSSAGRSKYQRTIFHSWRQGLCENVSFFCVFTQIYKC